MSERQSFVGVILASLESLWPCYNGVVEIVNIPTGNPNQPASARGQCPHCGFPSYFQPVGNPHIEALRLCNAAQCQSCKDFVLIVCNRSTPNVVFKLEALYPLGKPNDSVDPAVPGNIAKDFAEALRCRWVKAYKATVTMCRRTIQGSAIGLGAVGHKLVNQIDDLAQKGKITTALKEFAHEVRLTGNDGAHPDEDGLAESLPTTPTTLFCSRDSFWITCM